MNPLQPSQLRIDNPCPKTWDSLQGSGNERFCDACQHHVLDGTVLTLREAERLVLEGDGKVCMRVPVGPDGRLLFRDPEQARRSGLRALGLAVAASGVLAACQPLAQGGADDPNPSKGHSTLQAQDQPTASTPQNPGTATGGSVTSDAPIDQVALDDASKMLLGRIGIVPSPEPTEPAPQSTHPPQESSVPQGPIDPDAAQETLPRIIMGTPGPGGPPPKPPAPQPNPHR